MAIFLFFCVDQETGIDGTFCAGGIVLAGVGFSAEVLGNDGHSGFSWDINISFCVVGVGSPIVALGN